MKTNVIKVRFLRSDEPSGREYTYYTPKPVEVGDTVDICTLRGMTQGIVTEINVPEEEIAKFKDKAKSIVGKSEESETKEEPDSEDSDSTKTSTILYPSGSEIVNSGSEGGDIA